MTQHFLCWNGPCEGMLVSDVPMSVETGHACAIPWDNMGTPSYAVYILLEKADGSRGLVYDRNTYKTAQKAQARVQHITRVVTTINRMKKAASN